MNDRYSLSREEWVRRNRSLSVFAEDLNRRITSVEATQRGSQEKTTTVRYGGKLEQACQALHHLNLHYCKNDRCNPKTKELIYRSYKKPMIKWLCENGHCIKVTRSGLSTKCRECNGSGVYLICPVKCRACNGTGVYHAPHFSDTLLGFAFMVEGEIYKWHLPETQADFPVPSTSAPQFRFVRTDKRTLGIKFSDIEAKAVIDSFLDMTRRRLAS
jgi:hypothetical protein